MIFSSGTSFPPASIITTASFVEETIKSKGDASICPFVGLITYLSPSRPTRKILTGPIQGIDDRDKAAETAIAAVIAGEFSISTDKTVKIT